MLQYLITTRLLLSLLLSMLLSSCDVLLDKATDCIDNDKPEFNQKTLQVAVLNQEYSQEISVSIANEPYDDWYNYRFSFDGQLPEGLEWDRFDKRVVTIHGTPTETGIFTFSLTVRVYEPDDYIDPGDYLYIDDTDDQYYDDGDDLCRNHRDRTFVIEVREGVGE